MVSTILGYLRWIDSAAGPVWVFLLTTLLVVTLVQVNKQIGRKNGTFNWGIFLLVSIYLYPLYTGFYKSLEIGMIGNVVTFVFTLVHQQNLKNVNPRLSRLMWPQLIWLTVATIYVGLQLAESYM
ncbi:MAG: tryptophan-rich sensory protein [Bacteroidota bacterium]